MFTGYIQLLLHLAWRFVKYFHLNKSVFLIQFVSLYSFLIFSCRSAYAIVKRDAEDDSSFVIHSRKTFASRVTGIHQSYYSIFSEHNVFTHDVRKLMLF